MSPIIGEGQGDRVRATEGASSILLGTLQSQAPSPLLSQLLMGPLLPPLSAASPLSEVSLIYTHIFTMTHLVLRNFRYLKVKGTDTAR